MYIFIVSYMEWGSYSLLKAFATRELAESFVDSELDSNPFFKDSDRYNFTITKMELEGL